jgi:drug/metabolite transporter superfamily protein YnfA
MSIIGTIQRGITFIRKSHYFALFGLGVSVFEGLLMSGLYFLIPLAHHNHYITNTSIYGREIGIHKLVAILFALTAGIVADRFARRKMDIGGWIVVLIGIGIMIYDPLGYGLII